MKKLKKGKVIAASLIVLLVGVIVGVISLSKYDKYAGLVKVNNAKLSSISTKLSANISDLSEENEIYTKGYDEVVYKIKYKLSEVPGDRDVIINAKIDENDPYARFKNLTGNNISSVLSSNGKEITITLSNLPSNEEIESKLILLIENAPKGYTVSPIVRIKESTEDSYTNVSVRAVTVNTNSLQGYVTDESGAKVPNIIVSLKKNNEIIKETYTNSEGIYTFSDIEPDTYTVFINEEIYENLSVGNLVIDDAYQLNLIVRRVEPYNIETNKYITKVELNNLGINKNYTYNDVTLAQIPVKRVDDLHGKIYYKITVQNTGGKEGIISSVRDELPEGLSFDESLNSGYELKDGIIYNRNLEGLTLRAGEQISDTLVLTIENTNVAKTYINKVNARGELYEHVVYLLNGSTYKTLDVLEGEKIEDLPVNNNNFSGWYTDEKLTNKYNFTLPVEKDLILYGVTQTKHTVVFNDKDPETLVETEYDRQEVPNGEKADEPTPEPSHTGYTFCGWDTENGTHWDFNTPVTTDLTLTSCYEINSYKVEFYDNSMNEGGLFELIDTVNKVYKSVIASSEAPDLTNAWAGHTFLKWTTDQAGQNAYDFTSLITGDIKLYAQYTLQDRLFIFDDEGRITNKTVNYGDTVSPIADQGKDGHTFRHWSLEQNGNTAFDFSTRIYQNTRVYAVYDINKYDVVFNDTDPWTGTTTEYDRQLVSHGSKADEPTPEPTKEGHSFCGWLLNGSAYDFDTPVTSSITLTSCYTKNKVHVTFMDGDNQYAVKEVDYGDTVTDTDTHPSKEHYIFKFWSEDNTNGFDYSTQIKADKTLYSVYEEVLPPEISHVPLYWTNDKVLVTVSSSNPNYTYKYKVDNGTYQDYTEPFELTTNSTIVAKSIYETVESTLTSHEVTNIDKLNPTIDSVVTTPSLNSIVVNASLIDNESGVASINIYKDGVLATTISGTAVNADLRDYTKTKSINYTLSGLENNTPYTIKVEVFDGAGNKTETTVTETTATPEIVARIISIDGVPLNEQDYIEFPLLALAIADTNCETECVIQMVKSTNESVSILDGQDITLDLNGKTVAGVVPGYTVSNNGEFTLIDNAETAGGLINRSGIAILNNQGATLTLGVGSSEKPADEYDIRTVSTTVPYVFGETYGIYSENNSELRFFDGLVSGTDSIYGEVTETEYSYNVNVPPVGQGEYEEASLSQLDNPEARINRSVYYSNVANAMGDTASGVDTSTTTSTSFLTGFEHSDKDESTANYQTVSGYDYEYDPDTDTLYSTNNIYGSKAFTSTTIDLTGYSDDQLLDIKYNITENSDGSKGTPYLTVTCVSGPCYPENLMQYSSGEYLYRLRKGAVYNIELSFTQPVQIVKANVNTYPSGGYSVIAPSQYADSQMIITSATLSTETQGSGEHTAYNNGIAFHGFYYDSATDTLRSGNQYPQSQKDSYAESYIEIDLTGKTGTYELSVSASMESYYYSYGRVYVAEAPTNPVQYYSSMNLLYFNSSYMSHRNGSESFYDYTPGYSKVGPFTGTQTLQGGKKYYVNFHYQQQNFSSASQAEFENNNISDQFIIDRISVVKTNVVEAVDIPNEMVGNAFDLDTDFRYRGELGYYGLTSNRFGEYHDSYIKVDLTDAPFDKILEIDAPWLYSNIGAIYITSNNRGLTNEYINANRYNMLMYKDDYDVNKSYPYMNYTYLGTPSTYNYLLEKGNVYYIHFNAQSGFDSSYYPNCNVDPNNSNCGIYLKGINIKNVAEKILDFGSNPINYGTVDYDSLPEDNHTITQSNGDSVNLRSQNVEFVYDAETKTFNTPHPLGQYIVAYYTTTIDTTNEANPVVYSFTANYQGGNNASVAYYTTDQNVPPDIDPRGNTTYPSVPYQYVNTYSPAYYSFEPGHIYYFYHYVTGTGNTTASFKLIKLDKVDETVNYTKYNKIITFNENVDEVQILKNIDLQSSIAVSETKETVLDLNGYKITSSLSDPIINNNGKLTIIDSKYETQTGDNKVHEGILESSAGDIIRNNGELTIKDCEIQVNTTSQSYAGINNNGTLYFDSDGNTKIYVNKMYSIGINNNGKIYSAMSPVEIVMNYKNQVEQNSSLYREIGSTSTYAIGLKNESGAYLNVGGLKITGKNSTGLSNSYRGVAVLRYANINVDINQYDKDYDPDNTNYKRWPYEYVYRSSNTYYPVITDYSIRNDGILTITDGSNISGRTYNGSEMLTFNSSRFGQLIAQNYSKTFDNSSLIENAWIEGDSTFENNGLVQNTLYNYGNAEATNGWSNTSIINNYGNFDGAQGTYNIINNYNNGTMSFKNASAKHILNQGKEITISTTTIDSTGSGYNEAIENSGILNLDFGAAVISDGAYGIINIPLAIPTENKYYNQSYAERKYTSYTYKQLELNIGTDLNNPGNVSITGADYGVTGNCYQKAYKKYFADNRYENERFKDINFIKYLDGSTEPIKESEYDQSLCIVNMYSGNITATNYPNVPSRAIDLAISNTIDNSYTYWNNGLHVTTKAAAEASNKTVTVAKIGSTEYVSVQDAVDSAPSGTPTTIDVLGYTDVSRVVIPEGKDITLNFENGHNSFLYARNGSFENNGTLTVTGTGQIIGYNKYIFDNNGTATFNNGTYISGPLYSFNEVALVNNKGNATINNGSYNYIDMYNTKNLTINNGSFIDSIIIGNGANSVSTIKGGYYGAPSTDRNNFYYDFSLTRDTVQNSTKRHIFELVNGATAVVDGLNTSSDSRYNSSNIRPFARLDASNMILRNGNVTAGAFDTSTYIVADNNSNVTFESGTYDNIHVNNYSSTVNVLDGNLTGTDNLDLITMQGISPVTNVVGGNLTSPGIAIGVTNYTVDPDSTYYDENWQRVSDDYSYEINIGTKGDRDANNKIICTKTSPIIRGANYGISTYGTADSYAGFLGFYDGTVKGIDDVFSISVDEIEEDYEVISDTEVIDSSTYNIKYLDQLDLVHNNNKNVNYKSFQQAFDEADSGDVLETLRSYTNTSNTPTITIANTANFTLKVNYPITSNNIKFIENNGNVTIEGKKVSNYKDITTNVAGTVFDNKGTLTLNNLSMSNIKGNPAGTAGVTSRDIIINNSGATLNVNGTYMETVQHTFINNSGTLNVDKYGTASCYDTAIFKVLYEPGAEPCTNATIPIINSGTADLDYVTIDSDTYCRLLTNSGTMTIDNSTFNQSSSSYEPNVSVYGSVGGQVISNGSSLSISNSNLIYSPSSASYNRGEYSNSYTYYDNSYITNSGNLVIDSCKAETSIDGFIKEYGNSNAATQTSIINSTIHNNSYGIIDGDYDVTNTINITNSNISTRDSIIEGYRYYSYHSWSEYSSFAFYVPSNNEKNGVININGGTYTSSGRLGAFNSTGSYTPMSGVTYSTMCSSGSMDSNELDVSSRYFDYNGDDWDPGHVEAYTNTITNTGTLNVSDATITMNLDVSIPSMGHYDRMRWYLYKDTINNQNYSSSISKNNMAVITTFGTANIVNSTVSISNSDSQNAIHGRGNDAELVLGVKDGTYDNQKPYIYSKAVTPIMNLDNIKFYDGVIESYGNIKQSNFADKETGYVITGDDNKVYLSKEKVIKNVTQDIEYTSIKDAVTAANNNDELKLLKPSFKSSSADDVTLNNKNITLDLNNKKTSVEFNLTGTSKLTVYDSTGGTDSRLFVNTNDSSTLDISSGNGIINANDNSIVNVNGDINYEINTYDSATLNITNSTVDRFTDDSGSQVNHWITISESSSINITDSTVDRIDLYDTATISTTCSTNNSVTFDWLENFSTANNTITCGSFIYGIYNGDNNNPVQSNLTLSNVNASSINNRYESTININNSSTTSITNYGTATINNSTATGYVENNKYISGSTTRMDVVDSTLNYSVESCFTYETEHTGNCITNFTNTTINGTVTNYKNSTMTIIGGSITKGITNSGTLTIGTKNSQIDTTSPEISYYLDNYGNGNKYGLKNSTSGTVNFYDGIITGTTDTGAIVGLINDIEPNYKISVVDNGNNTESAYLTLITNNDPRVAMVNGINYSSLQQAINKSVMNCSTGICPDVTIYLNIELDADLTITDGYSVNINSNGFSIRTNDFIVPSSITLDGNPIVDPNASGDIVNGIRGLLGLDPNAKNVLIYEMSDGSNLSTDNHYRLYSYENGEYELVTMEKGDEVARYTPGNGITNMKPIKGRLYLTNIKPGSYKVSDDNGSEVTFTIADDGTLSGHVKEYVPSDKVIESTGTAKLIISIQTGIRRVNYMFIAISLIAVLSIMFVLKRKSQNNKNLV